MIFWPKRLWAQTLSLEFAPCAAYTLSKDNKDGPDADTQ
jgi:hypothetical protein